MYVDNDNDNDNNNDDNNGNYDNKNDDDTMHIGPNRTFGIATQFQSTYLNYIFINRPWFQIVDIGMQPVIIKINVMFFPRPFFKFIFLLSWSLKKENGNIQIKIITFKSLISRQKMFTKFSIRVILHTPFLKIW